MLREESKRLLLLAKVRKDSDPVFSRNSDPDPKPWLQVREETGCLIRLLRNNWIRQKIFINNYFEIFNLSFFNNLFKG